MLGHGLARMPVAGAGPVYLMSVGDEPAGSVTIEDSRRDLQVDGATFSSVIVMRVHV